MAEETTPVVIRVTAFGLKAENGAVKPLTPVQAHLLHLAIQQLPAAWNGHMYAKPLWRLICSLLGEAADALNDLGLAKWLIETCGLHMPELVIDDDPGGGTPLPCPCGGFFCGFSLP